ncbi:MAG: TetR/AcrR family transcriptional regulator [Pseudomonadota bacterium]
MGFQQTAVAGAERDLAVAGRERRYRPFETRERILDAARSLFHAKGYLNTSTLEIADKAEVAEGSIFYHFGSKKNLLAALGAVFAREKVAAMRGGSHDLSDLEPGLTIRRAFDFVDNHGFIDDNLGLPFDSPEVQPFLAANRDVVVEFVSQCLHATLPSEKLETMDVELAASFAYSVVCDALCQVYAAQDRDNRDRILAETIRFVRQALGYPHDGQAGKTGKKAGRQRRPRRAAKAT